MAVKEIHYHPTYHSTGEVKYESYKVYNATQELILEGIIYLPWDYGDNFVIWIWEVKSCYNMPR